MSLGSSIAYNIGLICTLFSISHVAKYFSYSHILQPCLVCYLLMPKHWLLMLGINNIDSIYVIT